jgi:glycosyltransferase involved in cell wall biosynthesis
MSPDLPAPDQAISDQAVAVSIIVPVRNEAENIAPLIDEITAALDGRWAYEIIYVNDGSTDATAERLAAIMKRRTNLRQLRHASSSGQSAAVRSGVRAARGAIVATLDGDGQNNPAFLPDLVAANAPALPPVRGSAARIPVSRSSSRVPPTPSAVRSCMTAPATPAAASRRFGAMCS